jgi:predicted oxidoreductase (fatty acid repression mutant protein)
MANQEDKIRSELIAAIDELPVNYLEEVLAQVKSLKKKSPRGKNSAKESRIAYLSEASFARVWDNDEDSVYDKL